MLPKVRTGIIATHSPNESTYVQEKNHAPACKARVALAALSGEKTVAERSAEFGVHQTLIHKVGEAAQGIGGGYFFRRIKTEEAKKEKQLQVLHAKIGQLTVERDFLAEAWGKRRASPAGKTWSFPAMKSSVLSVSAPSRMLKVW